MDVVMKYRALGRRATARIWTPDDDEPGVRVPDWWPSWYPKRCPNGHLWGPGRITTSWFPCNCGGAVGGGHHLVYCGSCRFSILPPEHDVNVQPDVELARHL